MKFDLGDSTSSHEHQLEVMAESPIGRVLSCGCGRTRVLDLGAICLRFEPDALRALEALLGLAHAREAARESRATWRAS